MATRRNETGKVVRKVKGKRGIRTTVKKSPFMMKWDAFWKMTGRTAKNALMGAGLLAVVYVVALVIGKVIGGG